MAGAYCKFCQARRFVDRVIPSGPMKGWTGHLATCQGGMAHDLKVTGHTHLSAVNPTTDPEAADACYDPAECSFCGAGITVLGGQWTTEEGTTACTGTSAPFVSHKPKEGRP